MKYKLESRLLGEISITSEIEVELKNLLMKFKEEGETSGLNSKLRK